MNISISVTFTGTPDADDVLAARHAVFIENREINAQNSVLASQVPPGTPLPLLATSTADEVKASYLVVLSKIATESHAQNIKDAKSSASVDLRFTEAQATAIRANLISRLNAGQLATDIVTDTAGKPIDLKDETQP